MISPDTQKKTSLICLKLKNLKIQMSYNPLQVKILTTGGSFSTNGLKKMGFDVFFIKTRLIILHITNRNLSFKKIF